MKTILTAVVGSTLHGTHVDDGLEDLDLMSIVIEDAANFCGFVAKDVWVERTKPQGVRSEAGDTDHTIYGLRKYLALALKGNPTILLALFANGEHIKHITNEGAQFRALAPSIISQRCYAPFFGYMRQQHERLLGLRGQRNVTRPELVTKYGYDTKYAGHIVRLGFQGRELLRTGKLTLPMPESERQLVRDVRTGRYKLAEVSQLIIEAEEGLDRAFAESELRSKPDTEGVEGWMVQTYLDHWCQNA